VYQDADILHIAMQIVIAPDAFKETLTAAEACAAMAEGVRRVRPRARIICIPLADGGEGTVAALLSAGGHKYKMQVFGPLGDPVDAEFGVMADGTTAVVEMAAASGLELLPPERRDPLNTTTFGTGQLIQAAWRMVSASASEARLIVGAGGSATVDAGCGALQALGARSTDDEGRTIEEPLCGGALGRVQHIDVTRARAALGTVRLDVACDVSNPLCGPNGSACVYGPQKGATIDGVKELERNLEHIAAIFERDLGVRVSDLPRSGAAGGLPAGLHAGLGAHLLSGSGLIMAALRFAERAAGADLILTGEGMLDSTSLHGKVVGRVAEEARRLGTPAVAVVGAMGEGAEQAAIMLNAVYTLVNPQVSAEEARRHAAHGIAEVTAHAVRARLKGDA
jgi:glycerate kinase